MQRRYHFISGLPRSGQALLSAIFNQNPEFYSNMLDPLARIVQSVITTPQSLPIYNDQVLEAKRVELIQNLIKTYHSHCQQGVCFNTNYQWTGLLAQLEQAFPDSKVICCVRDINWILDSYERLFKLNPFTFSKMYNDEEAETVYTRAFAAMSHRHIVKIAYDLLKEAMCSPQKRNIMLIEYNQLVQRPKEVMQAIYEFIDEPYFEHNFTNVTALGTVPGIPSIRSEVKYIEREFVLPPDLLREFNNIEVWK